jgi:hypothetical protein
MSTPSLHRAFDDAYYCDMILEYLRKFGQGTRAKPSASSKTTRQKNSANTAPAASSSKHGTAPSLHEDFATQP